MFIKFEWSVPDSFEKFVWDIFVRELMKKRTNFREICPDRGQISSNPGQICPRQNFPDKSGTLDSVKQRVSTVYA